jgi:hypothetical protein
MTNLEVAKRLHQLLNEKKPGWDSIADSLILHRFYRGSREAYVLKYMNTLYSIAQDEEKSQ